jgi:hypothetical protein
VPRMKASDLLDMIAKGELDPRRIHVDGKSGREALDLLIESAVMERGGKSGMGGKVKPIRPSTPKRRPPQASGSALGGLIMLGIFLYLFIFVLGRIASLVASFE